MSGASDQGSVSAEFAIAIGVILLGFASLLVVAGRVGRLEHDVRSAAHAAARAASLRAAYVDAEADAIDVADRNLAASGLACDGGGATTLVSPSPLDFGPGALVVVEVRCRAPVVGFLGLGPEVSHTARASEVIDRFRGDG